MKRCHTRSQPVAAQEAARKHNSAARCCAQSETRLSANPQGAIRETSCMPGGSSLFGGDGAESEKSKGGACCALECCPPGCCA